MFLFGVHQFQPSYHEAGFVYDLPEHVMTLDHPKGKINVRVERHIPNTNEFRITAKLDPNQEGVRIRYSVSVWCVDTEFCDLKDVQTRVDAVSWSRLCVVDLSESLNEMQQRGGDAYLRISLNAMLTHEADEAEATGENQPGLNIHIRSTERELEKKNRLHKLLARVMFWSIAAIAANFIGRHNAGRRKERHNE